MANPSSSNVFIQAQAVLNEDWIKKSKKNVTEILEEIEKIGVAEIRFQHGRHVVFGNLEQLIRVQNHLAENSASPTVSTIRVQDHLVENSASGTASTRGKSQIMRHDGLEFRDTKRSLRDEFKTRKDLETDSVADAFFETKDPNSMDTKELMVDRDIWDFIESKKREDVKQLEMVFEATITKVEDESGVLRLILKSKSLKAYGDNLDMMLESLGELYTETFASCVTETTQFRLSDEESDLAVEYISGKFPDVLVKKCIYNDDFSFIGPRYEAREARKQFQVIASRMTKGHLRSAADKREYRWRSALDDYDQVYPRKTTDDYDERSYEDRYFKKVREPRDGHENRFKEPRDDHELSKSKCDRDESLIVIDDDNEESQEHVSHSELHKNDDDDDKHARGKDQEVNNLEPMENVMSSNHAACSAEKENLEAEVLEADSSADRKPVSGDEHSYVEPEPERKGRNFKPEDTPPGYAENLEQTFKEKERPKIGADATAYSTLCSQFDNIQLQDAVASAVDSSAAAKPAKKSVKSKKKTTYDLPTVKIVKQQKFPVSSELKTFADTSEVSPDQKIEAKANREVDNMLQNSKSVTSKSVVKQILESSSSQQLLSREERDLKELFHQQTKRSPRKPFDSPSSSDSENDDKKTLVAKQQEGAAFAGGLKNEPEELKLQGDENIEALIEELMLKDDDMSQQKLQKLLEKVASAEHNVDAKKSTTDAGKMRALPNTKSAGDGQKLDQSSTSENKKDTVPQPPDGTIACIIDKGFHLNGYPKSGTIEINMVFEDGFQAKDQAEPGRRYKGMKLKAFLPASGDGREALRLMKGAFAARKLFQIVKNENADEDDIIVSNGVVFKEGADQFPDPDYLPNVFDQLKKLTD